VKIASFCAWPHSQQLVFHLFAVCCALWLPPSPAAANFYIISQGACDVFHVPQQELTAVDISRATLASGTLQREDLGAFVGRLRAGECLGELPGLFSYKRSASVVTSPDEGDGATHLLQLDRDVYEALVAPVFKAALDSLLERAKFLRKLAVFSHWPAHETLFLANWVFVDSRSVGTLLWSCGDAVTNVQFVQSGTVDIKVLEPAVSLYQEITVETVFPAGMLLASDAYSRTKQRCTTAVCTSDASLLTIPAALFSRMVATNTSSGTPFQLQSKALIFKYAEFQRTWHALRITDCEDPTTFKMGYSLVHIVQNRFLPCGWCGDKGHSQADCHFVTDDEFSAKAAKLALVGSTTDASVSVASAKEDAQRPTRTRRRVASVVGENWLDNPNRVHAVMSPHSQAVQCTRDLKSELLTLRRAVWAFKRLLRRAKARKAAKLEVSRDTRAVKSPSTRRRSLNCMSSHCNQVASLTLPLTGPSPSNGRPSPGRVEYV
jgi:CRP-like cAMP-binding protein